MRKNKLVFITLLSSLMAISACGGKPAKSNVSENSSTPSSQVSSQQSSLQSSSLIPSSTSKASSKSSTPSSTPSSAPSSAPSSSKPSSAVTKYYVGIEQNELVTIAITSGSDQVAKDGRVTFTVTPKNAEVEVLTVKVTYVENSQVKEVNLDSYRNDYGFNMPAFNVTIKVTAQVKVYNLSVVNNPNATVTLLDHTDKKAKAGETVNFKVQLANGVTLKEINILNGSNKLTPSKNNDTYSFQMPSGDAQIQVVTEAVQYDVTISTNPGVNARIVGSQTKFAEGETVSFIASVNTGYELNAVKVNKGTEALSYTLTNDIYTFVMPAGAVTISFDVTQLYTVSKNADANTTITIESPKSYYKANDTVTFTVAVTNSGYELDEVTVKNGTNTVVTTLTSGKYSFKMPAGNVTISATAKEKPASGDTTCPIEVGSVFEGGYYTRSNDYYCRVRVKFDTATTLSWWLTSEWDGDDYGDEWTYSSLSTRIITKNKTSIARPSDMLGDDLQDSETGVEYSYNSTTGKVEVTLSPKASNPVANTIEIIKNSSGAITGIKFDKDIKEQYESNNYFGCKNIVLYKK
ncbi:MAG: hypothetical protein MJ248_05830 [Bacilli bacterium]|nr:hypothetical protein [Bacilli bacterium]